jgi:hypothetical protein
MNDMQLATATEIAPAVFTAECPTTHELFTADHARRQSIGARAVVWLLCPSCDALLHTGDDCDALLPQWHLYIAGKLPSDEDILRRCLEYLEQEMGATGGQLIADLKARLT